MTKDYEMYSCKGELLDMAGLQIPKDMYRNYEILVMRNEVVYKKLIMAPKFDEDDISGFKFDVLAGEYEFLHNGKSVGRMTVTDSNVVKDLTMPYKYVKIKMLDAEYELISIYPKRRLKSGSYTHLGNIEKGWKKRFEENIMFYFYSEGKKLRLPIKQIIYAEILNHDLDECRVNSFKELHAMIHRKLVRKGR